MTEPTEAMKAMARRICAEHDPNKDYQYLTGLRDDYAMMSAVLAAIIETQRADAAAIRRAIPMPGSLLQLEGTFAQGMHEAARIVTERGKDESNGN